MFLYFSYRESVMPTTAPRQKPHKPKRKSGWSPERRARHAASIKIWAPWAKSTGPRTHIGKQTSSMNALKHGRRTGINSLVNAALTRHGRFLTSVQAYVRLRKRQPTNELLKPIEKYLLMECVRCGDALCIALSLNSFLQKVIKNRANENG